MFHAAWVAAMLEPPIPHLQNTDGEDMVITRTHFSVQDAARLGRVLDAADALEREEGKDEWHWSGPNRQGETVSLGRLELQGETLLLETNSAARGERGRALVEKLAGDAVIHRATSHEDLERSVREAVRAGHEEDRLAHAATEGIPPEVLEDLTLDTQARHYSKWLDEEIPALQGRTPRQAAKDPSLRSRLAELIRGLEGMYLHALRRNEPAYDPSWMWAELELPEGAQPEHPPSLAHERWAEARPGWAELCRTVAARVRGRPGFDDASSILSREELEGDLDVRRFLKEQGGAETDGPLARELRVAINYELHRRKTFWVDEALVYMLVQTDLDVPGEDLRVPFPCFALVFTDRHVLSVCERLVAPDSTCPLAGHLLHAATVYVTEEQAERDRVLHLAIAVDALGADPPQLLEHDFRVTEGARVKADDAAPAQPEAIIEGKPVPRSRPLPGLLHVVLNAILYATSPGVEPEARSTPKRRSRGPDTRSVFSSEEVFYLPGKIKISEVRQMQALSRLGSGRTLLHRFMVRGHWRRPAKNWKERHSRWIKPYWKGPDIAAVIERTYKLTP